MYKLVLKCFSWVLKKQYWDNDILAQPKPTIVNSWNLQFEVWDNDNLMEPNLKENREPNSSQTNSWK